MNETNILTNLTTLPLKFENKIYTDVFKDKNNKTLKETIEHKRYNKFKEYVEKNYALYLDMNIGDFLIKLKNSNDTYYKNFLNRYGDLTYSRFYIEDKFYYDIKGVYFYFLDEKLQYIGRCKDSMKKRVNNGYGKISPKNCFLDGQATNCKINALISQNISNIVLKIYPLSNNSAIEKLEEKLIKYFKPNWNNIFYQ